MASAIDAAGFSAWLDRYSKAWESRDPTLAASLFTDDAALMYSNGPTVNGKQAIGEFLAKLYTPIDATGLRVVPEDLKVSGSLAAQRGTFEERFIAENTEKTEYGRFTLVAERAQDKSWRIRSLTAVVDSVR